MGEISSILELPTDERCPEDGTPLIPERYDNSRGPITFYVCPLHPVNPAYMTSKLFRKLERKGRREGKRYARGMRKCRIVGHKFRGYACIRCGLWTGSHPSTW